ncbi:hypothetical protein QWI17_17425 [Gilvimarinus sp. SDUM040013]|uniref:PrcB C-terminal domain-containing protein n=1 Tax=Gilvimarinus gilvus TaxID=3058038 RepID=A0ABU4RXI1_9GAMM|nr:hypothetical protein [Gilvimarinus sp. SDUM040013]MDO3387628.1 hypothetical protein [Gilvimarinus sp. SDUM040013]MDX6848931.1 hypothetical protein [Gilvimarinus sp. SDUM040013]
MRAVIFFTPLLLALSGCGGSGDNGMDHDTSGTAYAYQIVDCGIASSTSISEPSREVISDVHRFREVYGVTDLNNQDAIPDVNFDNKQVVAIHSGTKGNPAHGLRIDGVVTSANKLVVQYTAILPDRSGDCSYPTVAVYPYCFISMEKSELYVTYSEITEENSCGS